MLLAAGPSPGLEYMSYAKSEPPKASFFESILPLSRAQKQFLHLFVSTNFVPNNNVILINDKEPLWVAMDILHRTV